LLYLNFVFVADLNPTHLPTSIPQPLIRFSSPIDHLHFLLCSSERRPISKNLGDREIESFRRRTSGHRIEVSRPTQDLQSIPLASY
ncbi:hypothetical protein LINGRAHAP2_LOCUS22869, partial [Linum grandiflorum]